MPVSIEEVSIEYLAPCTDSMLVITIVFVMLVVYIIYCFVPHIKGTMTKLLLTCAARDSSCPFSGQVRLNLA